ncbi:MAG: flagellar biosynthesis protein FliQ [Ruminiclostridium sp.]|nr:flagellar biosynthesis protein FliQ [Ruminiclostridium sp.]HBI52640.1 flagellar biosynthetic protein FliQ [Oscillospiraceae bacterium]
MTQDIVLEVFTEAIILAFKLAVPTLLIAMLVGLVIAILQAATQVHEQTLTFAPKAVIVALALLAMGPWMCSSIIDFFNYIMDLMRNITL